MNSTTKKTLEDLHSGAKHLYVVREKIINEMSNKDYLKWVEKPELFKNLIQYLSEKIMRMLILLMEKLMLINCKTMQKI